MNHLITARTFASSALHEITEHGIGRTKWLKETITQARIEVMRLPDKDFARMPNRLQNDYITLMLFDAQMAVGKLDAAKAAKSLNAAITSLTMLLDMDAEGAVDRLIKSVFPTDHWGGMGERR